MGPAHLRQNRRTPSFAPCVFPRSLQTPRFCNRCAQSPRGEGARRSSLKPFDVQARERATDLRRSSVDVVGGTQADAFGVVRPSWMAALGLHAAVESELGARRTELTGAALLR